MCLLRTTSDLYIKLDMITLEYVPIIVAPGNGVESSTRLTAVRGKPVVGSATKSFAASTDSLEIERQRCRRLQAQLEEMTSAVSEIEKERNFYFSKLQKVEAYCQNAGEDASVQCEAILQILYEVEEGFAVPTVDERSEQNGTDSVVIATTGEKQMKNDEVSIVDARVKALHLNDSETF
uniref:EB1 C-terminal domain-containing protein n=1 Tax=Parascaris equorum TaxID=6256 RepID=A0A914R9W0_PAREQ